MPVATIEQLRELGEDFKLFQLAPLLASTKRRTAHDRHRLIALIMVHFLQDHGLSTRTILAPDAAIPDDLAICVGDLTDEGLAFYRDAEQKWLRAIDRGTSPTDTTALVNVLKKLRSR